jgi:hypothetical protein
MAISSRTFLQSLPPERGCNRKPGAGWSPVPHFTPAQMNESSFYFPPDICDFLHDTRVRREVFLTRLGQRDNINIDDTEKWSAMADAFAKDQAALR